MSRTPRIPVLIDVDVYNRFKALADAQSAPVTRVINNALTEWMDKVGDARRKAFEKISGGK